MKIKLLGLLMSGAIVFLACAPKIATTVGDSTNQLNDGHNAQNSLDWAGTYSGVEPCASCEGIRAVLKIGEDGKYQLTSEYLGVEDAVTDSKTGTFKWKDGNTIELSGFAASEGSALFKVEENRLRHLDMKGNIIKGALADNYILTKTGNLEVEDRKWQLIELNGKKIDGNPEGFYIIFNSESGMISAKAGCNTINIPYTIENQYRLVTGNGISTSMACADMETEKQLKEVIQMADNISFGNGRLSLNKGRMAPLAVFEDVE